MKKLRNITLIAVVVILAFGFLAKIIPGIAISDFAWGICVGLSIVLIIAGIAFTVTPLFCKKKKTEENSAETKK